MSAPLPPAETPAGTVGETGGPVEPTPARKPRRRGRTTLLIAVAAVLGVVAGGGLGYHIQDGRAPTPLPPLTGPMLAQPKGAGPAPAPLPESQDRQAVYDGDLLKLLVPVPKGAKDASRTWMTVGDYAEEFDSADEMFEEVADDDYRRGVEAQWTDRHGVYFDVELTQYRDEAAPSTPELLTEFQDGNAYRSPALGPDVPLAGTVNGLVWPSAKPDVEPGYLPNYEGRGLAEVGNILIEVYVDSQHKVTSPTVTSVITEQLERL